MPVAEVAELIVPLFPGDAQIVLPVNTSAVGLGLMVITKVDDALVPHEFVATTDKVPEVALEAKLTGTFVVVPEIETPVPLYDHVYEVAPLTMEIE